MHPFRPTTIETPDSARKTTISLVATGRVVLATTTHTMSGGMATALLAVTTIVATEETILVVVTWIRTLSLRGGETITQINMITSTIIAIPPPGEMEITISSLITKEIFRIIIITTTTSHIIITMVTTTEKIVRQTTTLDMEDNHQINITIFRMIATDLKVAIIMVGAQIS